jgi:hypothetical protein
MFKKLLLFIKTQHFKHLFLGIFFFLITSSAMASHFRHGTISWRVVSGNTIEFKISQAWANYGNWTIGQTGYSDRLYFGDGQVATFAVVATAVNSAENWYYGEITLTHTYTNIGNFTAYFASCCKIGGLSNNAHASWRNETIVNVGSGNESPVTTLAPIVNMQTALGTATLQVPATDPDGDILTYRLATTAELANGSQPSGFSINSTTGLMTFNTIGKNVGSLWNAAIVVEDGQTKVINDFIIKIVQQSNPPVFDYTLTPVNGTVIQVSPGVPVNFSVKADDSDPGAIVSLQSIGVPPGATVSLINTNTSTITGNFSWTPTSGNLGTNVINFIAQDNVGTQVSTSVSIIVSLKPQFDIPPTPISGAHNIIVSPGSLIQYTVQASDPDPADVVQIINVEGKDMMGIHIPLYAGASFNSLPTVAANPTSGTFSWTPTQAQWGHRHIFFTAQDSYGDQTVHEVSQLVNTPPIFTSTPILNADVGTPYSYTIQVTDPDLPFGDELTIFGNSLPSWLSVTDNGDGTATLTGIPSVSSTGINSINIQAEDKHHHQDPRGIIMHNFDITVNNCTVNASTNNVTIQLDANGNASIIGGINSNSLFSEDFTSNSNGLYTTSNSPNNWAVLAGDIDLSDFISGIPGKEIDLEGNNNGTIESSSVLTLAPGNYEFTFDYVNNNAGSGNSFNVRLGTLFNETISSPSSIQSKTIAFTVTQTTTAKIKMQQFGPSDRSGTFIGNIKLAKLTPTFLIDNESSASCGIANIGVSQDSFTCANLGNNTVTLTITDTNGNNSTSTATVTVQDQIAPTVVGQNISVTLTASGTVSIAPEDVLDNGSDNCGLVNYTVSQDTFGATDAINSPVTIQLTGTDASGNETTVDVQVTVIDPVPVVITQDITIALDANGNATITAGQIDNGSNSVVGLAEENGLSLDITTFDCSNVGTPVTVTLTATSTLGSSATGTAIVTIVDTTTPIAITQDITVQLDVNGNATITPEMIDNGSSDNCAIDTMTLDVTSFDCANVGNNTVIFTITDVNGNNTTETVTITVEDNINPTVITQNVTIQLDANGNATVTPEMIDNDSSDNCAVEYVGFGAPVTIPSIVQTTHNTNNNSTGHGQSFTATQSGVLTTVKILVNGNSTGRNIHFYNNGTGSGTAWSIGTPMYTESNVSLTDSAGGVIWSEINLSTPLTVVAGQQYSFIIEGNTDIYYSGSAYSGGQFLWGYDASSGCCSWGDIAFQLDFEKSQVINFNCSNIGKNTVTLTVMDVNGNISTETATVTVEDSIAPTVITQNITIELDASGNATITPQMIDNGSTDNCAIDTVVLDTTSFDCSNIGENTVILTVTDVNGNASTATANITVVDNIKPIIATQNLTVQLDANGAGSITAAEVNNGSSDNCAIDTMALDTTSFDCSNVGTNKVIFTVTDVNGNSSSATAIITVEDSIVPTVITQNVTLQLDSRGNASVTPDQVNNGSTDNCAVDTTSLDTTNFSCSDLGENIVTLTVTDINGNSATSTAVITIIDSIDPSVITQSYSIDLANGVANITASNIDGGTFDNCDFTLTIDRDSFSCSDIGDHTVTLTATDSSGNTSSDTATVTVVGEIPVISISDFTTVQTQNTNTIYLGFGDQSVNLSTIASGGSSFTYQWTASTGEFVENVASPEISPTTSTTYTVIATNNYGCTTSTSIDVCVMEARDFNKKGKATGKVLVCHHTNGKKGTKHVLISISSNAVMQHLSNHGVETNHGDTLGECGATCLSSTPTVGTLANQDIQVEQISEFLVYPNPSNGIFNIKLKSVNSRTELTLFDVAGKVVSRETAASSSKSQNISIGHKALPAGIYILKIISTEESIVKKLIIKK